MIAASVSVFAMAALFVAFGLLRLGDGRGCGSGHCDSCSHDCTLDPEGRHP
ncbi:MAG: hypothetical protein AMXMBFR53_20610 [Gemmatimonadota bacterium]